MPLFQKKTFRIIDFKRIIFNRNGYLMSIVIEGLNTLFTKIPTFYMDIKCYVRCLTKCAPPIQCNMYFQFRYSKL